MSWQENTLIALNGGGRLNKGAGANPLEHTQTVSSTAKAMLDGITLDDDTTHLLVAGMGATVRYRYGAAAPTASVGYPYLQDEVRIWTREEAQEARLIRVGSVDATLLLTELRL